MANSLRCLFLLCATAVPLALLAKGEVENDVMKIEESDFHSIEKLTSFLTDLVSGFDMGFDSAEKETMEKHGRQSHQRMHRRRRWTEDGKHFDSDEGRRARGERDGVVVRMKNWVSKWFPTKETEVEAKSDEKVKARVGPEGGVFRGHSHGEMTSRHVNHNESGRIGRREHNMMDDEDEVSDSVSMKRFVRGRHGHDIDDDMMKEEEEESSIEVGDAMVRQRRRGEHRLRLEDATFVDHDEEGRTSRRTGRHGMRFSPHELESAIRECLWTIPVESMEEDIRGLVRFPYKQEAIHMGFESLKRDMYTSCVEGQHTRRHRRGHPLVWLLNQLDSQVDELMVVKNPEWRRRRAQRHAEVMVGETVITEHLQELRTAWSKKDKEMVLRSFTALLMKIAVPSHGAVSGRIGTWMESAVKMGVVPTVGEMRSEEVEMNVERSTPFSSVDWLETGEMKIEVDELAKGIRETSKGIVKGMSDEICSSTGTCVKEETLEQCFSQVHKIQKKFVSWIDSKVKDGMLSIEISPESSKRFASVAFKSFKAMAPSCTAVFPENSLLTVFEMLKSMREDGRVKMYVRMAHSLVSVLKSEPERINFIRSAIYEGDLEYVGYSIGELIVKTLGDLETRAGKVSKMSEVVESRILSISSHLDDEFGPDAFVEVSKGFVNGYLTSVGSTPHDIRQCSDAVVAMEKAVWHLTQSGPTEEHPTVAAARRLIQLAVGTMTYVIPMCVGALPEEQWNKDMGVIKRMVPHIPVLARTVGHGHLEKPYTGYFIGAEILSLAEGYFSHRETIHDFIIEKVAWNIATKEYLSAGEHLGRGAHLLVSKIGVELLELTKLTDGETHTSDIIESRELRRFDMDVESEGSVMSDVTDKMMERRERLRSGISIGQQYAIGFIRGSLMTLGVHPEDLRMCFDAIQDTWSEVLERGGDAIHDMFDLTSGVQQKCLGIGEGAHSVIPLDKAVRLLVVMKRLWFQWRSSKTDGMIASPLELAMKEIKSHPDEMAAYMHRIRKLFIIGEFEKVGFLEGEKTMKFLSTLADDIQTEQRSGENFLALRSIPSMISPSEMNDFAHMISSMIEGSIEGFLKSAGFRDAGDLTVCHTKVEGLVQGIMAAIQLWESGHRDEARDKIEALAPKAQECAAVCRGVGVDILSVLFQALQFSPEEFISNISHNIAMEGPVLAEEAMVAMRCAKEGDFKCIGQSIGSMSEQIIVGPRTRYERRHSVFEVPITA